MTHKYTHVKKYYHYDDMPPIRIFMRLLNAEVRFESSWGHQVSERDQAHVAQSVEHPLGKREVMGSKPIVGSKHSATRLE
jgi:hypothetical protein